MMDWAILDLLRADGSITINKRLIQKIKCPLAAMMFSELASRYCYFRDRGRLTKEGYFFNTVADIEEATCITRRQQDAAVKLLTGLGIIEMRVMGIPATRHFRFTEKNIRNLNYLLTGSKNKVFKLSKKKTEDDILEDQAVFLCESFQGERAGEPIPEEAVNLAKQAIKDGKAKLQQREKYGVPF
jgi:hypothetical protein